MTAATDEGLTPEELAAYGMAQDALHQAVTYQNWDAAVALAQGIIDVYGPPGMQVAILAWADAVIEHRGGNPDSFTHLTFFDVNEGPNPRQHGADEAPPWARWAGRFIFARALSDFVQCKALMGACADAEELCNNVFAVLEMAAQTILHDRRYGHGH